MPSWRWLTLISGHASQWLFLAGAKPAKWLASQFAGRGRVIPQKITPPPDTSHSARAQAILASQKRRSHPGSPTKIGDAVYQTTHHGPYEKDRWPEANIAIHFTAGPLPTSAILKLISETLGTTADSKILHNVAAPARAVMLCRKLTMLRCRTRLSMMESTPLQGVSKFQECGEARGLWQLSFLRTFERLKEPPGGQEE
ncbi:hypothetical protein DFH08DRAFT_825877 [Mycena albidolilacea]|uniref:Uncharacterized protein n=1 Tax=Mycena albidolilacea TaxID=1033008 RepID=A0AAD6Z105_9AGAR|nr:hypothetical protein DFH08DRAFT_825877 [Mycena albidolilacea]